MNIILFGLLIFVGWVVFFMSKEGKNVFGQAAGLSWVTIACLFLLTHPNG